MPVRATSLGRDYRRVWAAATASSVGDGVFLTALPLLAVTVSRDPLALSSVTFGLTVPWLVFALLSGALVDRWDRIATMRRVDLLRCGLTAGLAVVVALGATSIPVLVGFALALGTAETLFDSASLAVVPGIVGTDSERLTRANARLEGANIVANGFVGPPVGAGLFAAAPALPAVINAASFLVSTLLLRGVRVTVAAVERPTSNLRQEIGDGLRWLTGQPLLTALAVVVGVMNLALAAAGAVLVLLVQDEAGAGNVIYTIVLTAAAAGALAGTMAAERYAARMRPIRVLPPAVCVLAASLVAIGAFPRTAVIVAGFTLIGLAGGLWNVITVALRQRVIPDDLLGRVNSVYRLLAYGTMPVGALFGGALARAFGLRAPLLAGGILVAVTIPGLARALHRSERAERCDPG